MMASRKSGTLSFRIIAVIAPVLLLWGIPEVVVRLANPVLQPYRAIYFGNDANSPLLFMQDPVLFWKLRPKVSLGFKGVQVRTNADGCRGREFDGGRRNILFLGDSTTFGWGVEESESYPAILESLLNQPAGGKAQWQSVNAGVPGYSSYQMMRVAPELIRKWQPEVVVLCVGNNDSWPAVRSDRAIAESRRWSIRFQRIMGASHYALWLKEKLNPQTPEPFIAESLEGASPRVSTADFADNVRELVRAAQGHQARVIIVEPPVNLYRPPFATRKLPDLDQRADWCRDVHRLAVTGRTEEAIRAADTVLQSDTNDVYALWLKGFAITASGGIQEGRKLLEEALESHPFPEGCRRTYRDFLQKVAEEEDCGYVPVNQMLLALEIEKGPMGRLYIDACHPRPEGHRVIAKALRALIRAWDVSQGGTDRSMIERSEDRSAGGARRAPRVEVSSRDAISPMDRWVFRSASQPILTRRSPAGPAGGLLAAMLGKCYSNGRGCRASTSEAPPDTRHPMRG